MSVSLCGYVHGSAGAGGAGDIGSPRARVTGRCEPPHMGAGNRSIGPL